MTTKEERATALGKLRWIHPPMDASFWHLGWNGHEALCGAKWSSALRSFGMSLENGPPERKCLTCQEEIARQLGLRRV